MKLFRKNIFTNLIAKIVEKDQGVVLDAKFGKVESFANPGKRATNNTHSNRDEKIASMYRLYVHSAYQHDDIIKLINEGYTVIANTELLSYKGKKVLEANLKRVLAQYGLSYHSVSSDCFMVAPNSVNVIDKDEQAKNKKLN